MFVGIVPEVISIHAPLRGRPQPATARDRTRRISIHAPLRGRQREDKEGFLPDVISIHAPLRGRPVGRQHCPESGKISIHAPLRGRQMDMKINKTYVLFQSTPPCGGDHRGPGDQQLHGISIHAPLRGRHVILLSFSMVGIFQSTPPCGGDHLFRHTHASLLVISIHAPLRGRLSGGPYILPSGQFQSTPPCGGDVSMLPSSAAMANFNPRPLAGATGCVPPKKRDRVISIHAPLRGRLRVWTLPTVIR